MHLELTVWVRDGQENSFSVFFFFLFFSRFPDHYSLSFFPPFSFSRFPGKRKFFFFPGGKRKLFFFFLWEKKVFFLLEKKVFFSFSNWQSQKLEYFTLLVLVFRFLTPTSKKDVLSHSQNSTNMCIYTSTSNVIF